VTVGAALTVNVLMQVTGAWQSLFTVKVTVVEPPHADGAPVLLFVKTGLQPPLTETVANQVANFALMAAWVWQAASVVVVGQLSTTGDAFTVKLRVQVVGTPQLFDTVKVTVDVPPQADGAPRLLLVKTALQPPVKVAVASQVAYFALMAACV
jgi:hypothetical protein